MPHDPPPHVPSPPPTRRVLLAAPLVLAASLAASLAPRRARADEPLRVGWLRAANDAALARARGEAERVMAAAGAPIAWVGPFPAAAPVMEALNAGALDAGVGASIPFVAAAGAGAPLVAFGAARLGPRAEAILVRDPAIREVRDLAGRAVAVNRGGTGDYLLARALAGAGMAPDAARRVFLGPADGAPAFAAGAVDAFAAWDPFLAVALERYGARVLVEGGALGSENAALLVARRAVAGARRPALNALLAALRADNARALADPAAAGALWARELGLPPALGPDLGARNASPLTPLDAAAAAALGRVADWCAGAGVVPRRPDLAPHLLDLTAG